MCVQHLFEKHSKIVCYRKSLLDFKRYVIFDA